VIQIRTSYSPRADTYAAGCSVRYSGVLSKRILRTSPFGDSPKFVGTEF
jgi:hypothetical protein